MQADLERLLRADAQNNKQIFELKKSNEELKANCFRFQDQLQAARAELKKRLLPAAPPAPALTDSSLLKIEDYKKRIEELTQEKKDIYDRYHMFVKQNVRLMEDKRMLTNQLNIFQDLRAQNDHLRIHYKRDETWKELLYRCGKEKFNLSQDDIDSINFPVFNPEKVFYANATGQRFHSVRWCYRLDSSIRVDSCTYVEAIMDKRTPCHACIDLKRLPEVKFHHD